MKGLELARSYSAEVVEPAFHEKFPEAFPAMAFGLAGPGSECYEFDDELSRDHDWGPRVCIWVPGELFRTHGSALQAAYDALPSAHKGYGPVKRLDPAPRDGVMAIPDFYRAHLGSAGAPESLREWLLTPEEGLSLCTNGEVFRDPTGEFTAVRRALEGYFPEELWRKKIASRCMAAGGHGQYNMWRAASRGETVAAKYHELQFARELAALVHLLHRTYRPHAKWIFRSLRRLGETGAAVAKQLERLVEAGDVSERRDAVQCCTRLALEAVAARGLVSEPGPYLLDCGLAINESVEDPLLRERLQSVE
jgi:hypothetical protein